MNQAPRTINIPVNPIDNGDNQGVTVDISTDQLSPPDEVDKIRVTYGGSGGTGDLGEWW